MEAYMDVLVWLGIMIFFLVVEVITVGLTTIWFAAGALAAVAACAAGIGIAGQAALFFVVSFVLLIFTRPVALKYFNPHKIRTNYEDAVDKTVKVTERVDNKNGMGKAVLNGQEWTARMCRDDVTAEEGEILKVAAIAGVKLILEPLSEGPEKQK